MESYHIYYFGSFIQHVSRFTYVSAYISSSFLLLLSSIPFYEYISQFAYPLPVGGHLSYFPFLAIINTIAISILTQDLLWTSIFIYLGYIPKTDFLVAW